MYTARHDITAILIFAMVLPLGSTSCSDKDEPAPPVKGESFIAFTNPETREAVTTQSIREFEVWAFTDPYNKKIMSGIDVRRTGLNSWSYSPVTQWPDGEVDFYAVSPVGMNVDINLPYSHSLQFPAGDGTTDLLVSVKMNARQSDGHIRLNFCHTLARVTTEISTPLTDTEVRVKRISVVDVGTDGRYNIPLSTTVKDDPSDEVTAAWEIWNMSGSRFNLFFDESSHLTVSSEPYWPEGKAEFFLPVRFNPLGTDGGYVNGSAIEVAYQLYDKATGTQLWPKGTTHPFMLAKDLPGWGAVYFSLLDKTPDGRWYAGREYHYKISINGEATPPGARSIDENFVTVTTSTY